MEKKTTRKKIDWQQFFITVIGTAIGVALTFVVSGILERRNKAQAQRLTAIMVIHDIDNTVNIFQSWKDNEEKGKALLMYALEHKDQKEAIPSDTLMNVLNLLVRSKTEYHFDTSKEQIFNSDADTWQNLENMKFIDNVQEFFYERQRFLEIANNAEWFREPIPDEEYMQVIMNSGWVTEEEYFTELWAFLRDKLQDKRVAYYINVSHARVEALTQYIDKFTLLNEENKFIMGITDQELEDYVNSLHNNGIALTKGDLPGRWLFASRDQNMEYTFHSDNTYTYSNAKNSSYVKTPYWSGVYTVKVTYKGTWALQRDSLVLTPDYASSDVLLDPSGIVVEKDGEKNLADWLNQYQETTLNYFREEDDKEYHYAIKARLDSSRDKMEWTEADGTVRYLKRKRE
ncbi:MAG: hypothetical protein IKR96_04890 [Bacteroidales bacterium]|nr:hypothetical protein [Bacteroidales bacterium]